MKETMSKICTTIEQSKKLMELGIDVHTADMNWEYDHNNHTFNDTPKVLTIRNWDDPYNKNILAWSLTVLLGLMPKLYEFENDPDDGGCQSNLCKGWDNNQWHIVYRSSIYITEWYDEPIDAAFAMVCWLLENKKL